MNTESITRTYSEIVRTLVCGFLQHPETLKVDQSQSAPGVIHVDVVVARDDRPQVMGKMGARAEAVRHILNIVARSRGETVTYGIENSTDMYAPRVREFVQNKEWNRDLTVKEMLKTILDDICVPGEVLVSRYKDRTNFTMKPFPPGHISEELLAALQGIIRGYGMIHGWKCYLTVSYDDSNRVRLPAL